jgi:hypothetical protein
VSRVVGLVVALFLGLTFLVAPTTASAKELPDSGSSKVAEKSALVEAKLGLKPGVSYKRVRHHGKSDRRYFVTNDGYNGTGATYGFVRRGHKAPKSPKRIFSMLVPAGCDVWVNGAKFWQNNGPEHDWFNLGKYPWFRAKVKLVC